jgi:hypothetical protein
LVEHPSMKERQDQFGEVVGAAVVGVVGARDHRQLTQREQPGSGLCPGHGHDRLGAAPRDQRRRPDQGQLVLDRVAQGMGQCPDDPARSGVVHVADQDGQLQRVLAGGVTQPAQDLAGRGAGCRVHRGADQDQATDPVGMAHGQVDGDLAAEGVAQHRHGWQPGCLEPGGQVVGVLATSSTLPGSPLSPKPGRSTTWTGWWSASLAASGIR